MPKTFKKIYHKRSAHLLKRKTGQLSIPMKFFIEKTQIASQPQTS